MRLVKRFRLDDSLSSTPLGPLHYLMRSSRLTYDRTPHEKEIDLAAVDSSTVDSIVVSDDDDEEEEDLVRGMLRVEDTYDCT